MTETMWANGLAAVPLAALVLVACMTMRLRPSTRHLLWAVVMATLVVPPLINARKWGERFATHWTPSPRMIEADPMPESVEVASRPEVVTTPEVVLPLRFEALDHDAAPDLFDEADLRAPYSPTRTRASFYLPEPREASSATSAAATRLAFGDLAIEDPALEESTPVPSLASRWASSLGDVRRALTSLPPLPALVWWSGCALIVLVGVLRVRGATRLLRRAVDADDATVAIVRAGSRMLGLKRAPRTKIVDATISPMIVCTLPHPVLVLPRSLWRDLDAPGRLAVVCHECAHLRRGDHWLCWLDLIIGCLYWWHPVVWFVRRRMRDEADLACDAWVIDALPHARRSYAEALLETKAFVSMTRTPAPTLGATSAGARNFTRRITMVMTNNATPKLS
ncbi:MAG: M56 family metallopeptidase, partial [Phycisphaerales bacterium]|nr:M56 family metallopeptidase [Phycisphaerales bacterium]